jgi:UDP-N-acetylglucosamine acyltransferase
MRIHDTAIIHPSAIIQNGAKIGAYCEIGPFSVIGGNVILEQKVIIKSHVVISGYTIIGDDTVIFPFASIGEIPQDKKFMGEKTNLIVGKRNIIRENVTMNPGTKGGGGVTNVGDDCLFMTGAHVGHDAGIGNKVVVANQSAIAGHCIIDDYVIIGGLSGIHQFVRIGKGAIVGGLTMVTHDVIPYGMVAGERGSLRGLNVIGLKRMGLEKSKILKINASFKTLFNADGALKENARVMRDKGYETSEINEILNFILANSDRSFLTMDNSN